MTDTGPEVGSSLIDEVADRLREMIISGEVAPGEKIPIRMIEERLGVSHIPIREALRRLEAEHLVTNIPRRGAIATPVSVEQLMELYDFRRLIEPEIAVRAAHNMTVDDLAALEACLATLDGALESDPASDDFIRADREFHWAVLAPGATPLVERTLVPLWQMCERYVRLGMRVHGTPTRTRKHHHAIYQAVRKRDDDAIRHAIETHLALTEGAFRAARSPAVG